MAFKDYLTVDGERMMALAAAGTKITFTRMIMGSGTLQEGTSEKNVTQVIKEEKELQVQAVRINDNSTVLLQFYFSNAELEEGFYYRESAVYATDGNKEVLAIYGNAKDQAEYIDTPDVVVIEKKIKKIIQLSSEEIENIELSNATNAQAPVLMETTLEDFVNTETAKTLDVGQVVILNSVPYTYVGYNCNDIKCYKLGGSDDSKRQGSVTNISDDLLSVETVYDDGTKSTASFSVDMSTVVEKQYDVNGSLIGTYETVISGNTITERVI